MLELNLHTSSNKTKTMGVYCQIYQCPDVLNLTLQAEVKVNILYCELKVKHKHIPCILFYCY